MELVARERRRADVALRAEWVAPLGRDAQRRDLAAQVVEQRHALELRVAVGERREAELGRADEQVVGPRGAVAAVALAVGAEVHHGEDDALAPQPREHLGAGRERERVHVGVPRRVARLRSVRRVPLVKLEQLVVDPRGGTSEPRRPAASRPSAR